MKRTKTFSREGFLFCLAVGLFFAFSLIVLNSSLFNQLVEAEDTFRYELEKLKVVDVSPRHKDLKEIQKLIQYWNNDDNKDKTPKPLSEKFLTWYPWPAGLNNRRISFEVVYALAHILNRTLVLPAIMHMGNRQGYPERLDFEFLFEERDLRSGIPMVTAKEWENFPNKKEILNDTFVLPWRIGNGNKTVFVVPKKVGPEDSAEENEEFDKWWGDRQDMKDHHVVDQYTLGPRFLEARNIEFKKEATKFVEVNKLIRDHLHFPDKSTSFSAKVVQRLGGPQAFCTMHYRRDDLQFTDQRKVTPLQVFNITYDFYKDNDTIYVSTDEVPEVFDTEFVPIFSKRYHIVTLRNYSSYVRGAEKVFIPMIEMQIASQGRIFVGTQLSTFSMYITRLRGYSKHIVNKSYLMTTGYNWYHYPRHVDWDMEHEEAWNNLKKREYQEAHKNEVRDELRVVEYSSELEIPN